MKSWISIVASSICSQYEMSVKDVEWQQTCIESMSTLSFQNNLDFIVSELRLKVEDFHEGEG